MNNSYLPTLEEVEKICERCKSFYIKDLNVHGYQVKLADYRLASFGDFVNNNAFELRGLCFVNNNGTWERNILLNKFFNMNEVGPSSKTFLIELENGETIELTEFDEIKLTNGKYKRGRDLNINDDIVI